MRIVKRQGVESEARDRNPMDYRTHPMKLVT
jgi:hypothetical protein